MANVKVTKGHELASPLNKETPSSVTEKPIVQKAQPAPQTLPNPIATPEIVSVDLRLEADTAQLNDMRYDGDAIDNDGPLPTNTSGTWETIPFESPFELIYFFSPHLQDPAFNLSLHPWQIEVTEMLATAKPTLKNPLRFALCAANGSGKDAYVIAPFVIWFALTKIRSLTIITSSSGVQLTAQTENYIASLARTINSFYGEPIFKITKRFIKCLKSGSEIRMFATDEAGKAEGYHPFPDHPNAEMAIIVNEAKSVLPEIFGALSRCTGYNYWLNVSTPGEPKGDFHKTYTEWTNTRRVTAFECPHIPLDHINEVKRHYGEDSVIYRSQVLALFTSIGGSVVVDQDHMNRCIELSKKGVIKPKKFGKIIVGIDTAAGRDENAGVAVWGNCIVETLFFVERDTVKTEDRLDAWLNKLYTKYSRDNVEINADDGGVSHGIIDHLVNRGHIINRVLNQTRAFDFKQFGNRGTEMWYNVRRMIEEQVLYLPLEHERKGDDELLYTQLCYRHFKENDTNGRITLRSKKDEKADGHPSPDRADALVLALSSTDHLTLEREVRPPAVTTVRGYTPDELRLQKFEAYRKLIVGDGMKTASICNNSLEEALELSGRR